MPFPMKIQPLDSQAYRESIRNDSAKPVLKSRLKRLFDRQFPSVLRISSAEKPATGEQQYGKDGGAEFEPSSLCLAKMVQNFIEETNEKQSAAKCGRNRCNCFNGNITDSSDDEFDLSSGFGDSIPAASSSDSLDMLTSLIPCASVVERNLLADTSKIVERNKSCKRKDDLRKIVADGLLLLGYDASICKSRWEKSPAYPAGEYEYIDVIVEGERVFIDIDFRSEFEFGPTVRLTVSDPDLIREIFTSKSEYYEKNEAHPLIKQLEGDGLLSLKGEKWAHHRKIITPTFHLENLKLLIPAAANSVVGMLEKWSAMSDSGEVEIEVSDWFQTLTEDIITRTAFGSSYEAGKAIFRLQAQQMALASEAFQKVFIPGYRFLPTRRNMKSWKLDKEIKKSLVNLIDRRRENSCNQTEENGPKDLLGLMIQASTKESVNKRGEFNSSPFPKITVHDIAEECKSFFFAGEQTTSNLLTWTTVLLAIHPQWQVQAREEVLKVCGPRDLPSKDDIAKLKTLPMILNETLRLYPPIVATIRRAKTDVELGGCKVPHGTELLIPILAVHHDQAIWGNDANEFNPARFSEGVARAAKHPVAFIPFGLGVRTCIGQNLAILQAKLTLAIILQRFSFHLSPHYQHAPTVLMLLYPQYGAPIIFRRLADPTINPDQRS